MLPQRDFLIRRAGRQGGNAGAWRQRSSLVENVVTRFIERYAKANTREGTWRETERVLIKEIAGPWKGRRLSAIGRGDVHAMLDEIVDRPAPILANRTLALFRRMCNWSVERGIIATSPCEGVKAPSPVRSRNRVLSDSELRQVWKASEAIGWPFGALVKLLILSGQRRNEVAEMRWSEIDFDDRICTLCRKSAAKMIRNM
jgi:integrase